MNGYFEALGAALRARLREGSQAFGAPTPLGV
jgi:hypothetical protein